MDSKKLLLNEFFSTMSREQVKIETKCCGFEFLKAFCESAELDYGELKNGIYKYRLSHVTPTCFDRLLERHLSKDINLCVYLSEEYNGIAALNLDAVAAQNSRMKVFALYLMDALAGLHMPPLIVKSGHGYHFWLRFSEPVENGRLQTFLKAVMARATARAKAAGVDPNEVLCTSYPRLTADDISLRLFGSTHMKTGRFSSVVTQIGAQDTLLSEEDSWDYLNGYLRECTVTKTVFNAAYSSATAP